MPEETREALDNRFGRRRLLALAGMTPLAACATVPDADD
jgi:hypothetical protein